MLLIDRVELLLLTVALTVVAIACKFGGTMLAARVTGLGWRESAVLGTLMNTRGLTELIVLNLALEKGVISEALFAMLVIMALVTTFMAGPLLKLLDPHNEFGSPVERGARGGAQGDARSSRRSRSPSARSSSRRRPTARSRSSSRWREPLARSVPPRELILARLVRPPRGASVRGGLQTEDRSRCRPPGRGPRRAQRAAARRDRDAHGRVHLADPGKDLVGLAERRGVDLVLLDGRRPLLGEGVPRGDVGIVLHDAPCDVAVLVAREDAGGRARRPTAPIVVPFGGARARLGGARARRVDRRRPRARR